MYIITQNHLYEIKILIIYEIKILIMNDYNEL